MTNNDRDSPERKDESQNQALPEIPATLPLTPKQHEHTPTLTTAKGLPLQAPPPSRPGEPEPADSIPREAPGRSLGLVAELRADGRSPDQRRPDPRLGSHPLPPSRAPLGRHDDARPKEASPSGGAEWENEARPAAPGKQRLKWVAPGLRADQAQMPPASGRPKPLRSGHQLATRGATAPSSSVSGYSRCSVSRRERAGD